MQDKGIVNIGKLKKHSQEKNESLENKVKIIQANGFNEITEYSQYVNQFINKVRKLAICQKIMEDGFEDQIRFFLQDEIMNAFIKPVFEGKQPPFLEDASYLSIREDMYSALISRYIDKKEPPDRIF